MSKSQDPIVRHVAMIKRVASRWIEENAHPEYRLTIYQQGSDRIASNFPAFLRSFREGKVRLAKMSPIKDLGVHSEFDFVVVKSADFDALSKLDAVLTKIGCETSGVY